MFVCLAGPVRDALRRVGKVGYGQFYVELLEVARLRGAPEIAADLKGLSSEALHYFLVIGGQGGDESRYSSGISHEKLLRIFEELGKRDLIEVVRVYQPSDPDYPKDAGGGKLTSYKTTEKGRKAHSIMMDVIYKELATSK